jgi:hypothetical protein
MANAERIKDAAEGLPLRLSPGCDLDEVANSVES